MLSDPSNLPTPCEHSIGPETLDLLVSPINDENRNYLGPMVTWEVITQKLKMEQEIKENAEREKQKAEEMAKILDLVNANASTLGSSAEELTAVSTQMAANAEETSAQANVVSAASEQVSKNVQTVATGVEEMNSSIREIAKNATESARVAGQAVSAAEVANKTISKLGESSSEIGKVIKVITSIAEQTNLLALNATIEAARAGEAGKGFAVVANEVKELAKETAKATEDIGHKIEAIQADTRGAVDSIQQIGKVIAQINDISNTIASAVEEQTATANEMSRNVSEAAKGTAEIAQNITAVAQAGAEHDAKVRPIRSRQLRRTGTHGFGAATTGSWRQLTESECLGVRLGATCRVGCPKRLTRHALSSSKKDVGLGPGGGLFTENSDMRALIVDDSRPIRRIESEILQELGFETAAACNGRRSARTTSGRSAPRHRAGGLEHAGNGRLGVHHSPQAGCAHSMAWSC